MTTGARNYLDLDDQALLDQCDESHLRASGPGGQKRNKTSSAVRLAHRPTGLVVTASDDRHQSVNKKRAIRRLRRLIALEVRDQIDVPGYRPSDALTEVRQPDGRLQISERHAHYFVIVSEVLDLLHGCGMRLSDASGLIGTSTAHLVKFLQTDPALWDRVNRSRKELGLKPLR